MKSILEILLDDTEVNNLSEEEKLNILQLDEIQDNTNKEVYSKIIQIISSLSNKEKKLEYMEKYVQTEVGKAQVISTLDTDDEKIEQMEKYITAEYAKANVILSLTTDKAKIIAMDKHITNLRGITNIIESLQSDNNKVMAMDRYITDERLKAYVIKSIKDDEYKLEVMNRNIQMQGNKVQIIQSIQDDDMKTFALEELIKTEQLSQEVIQSVILTVQSDDKKLLIMSQYIDDEQIRTNIISRLQSDELKIDIINTKVDDKKSRLVIMKSIISQDKKLSLMEELVKEDSERIEILRTLPQDVQLQVMNKYISSEQGKIELVGKLREEYKFEAVERYLEDEDSKTRIIGSLKSQQKRVEALKYIQEEKNKVHIVASLQSDDIKKEYASNLQDEKLKKVLVNSMKQKENVKQYIDLENRTYEKIGLPENMTIGMEIECEGENSSIMHNVGVALTTDTNDDWISKVDETLNKGVEVVSPILTDNQNDVEDIYLVCSKLSNLGQNVTQRCGGHVHIGADFLTSKESYENLYEIWGNAEEIIFKMCNEKGDLPRQGFQTYAQAVAPKVNKAIEKESVNILGEEDVKSFISSLQQMQGERYSALNINNVNTRVNTIEFRVSNGTVNPDTWIENIRLYGRIIQMSEKIALLEKKDRITEEEKQIIQLKEKLKEDIPEDEKMETFLDMLFSEEEKDVYRQRYNETQKSIEANEENRKLFTAENIVVDFKKKKKEKLEFKDLAIKEKQSDIQKVEQDFIIECERGLQQEADIER